MCWCPFGGVEETTVPCWWIRATRTMAVGLERDCGEWKSGGALLLLASGGEHDADGRRGGSNKWEYYGSITGDAADPGCEPRGRLTTAPV